LYRNITLIIYSTATLESRFAFLPFPANFVAKIPFDIRMTKKFH